jgi:hypothetical protein
MNWLSTAVGGSIRTSKLGLWATDQLVQTDRAGNMKRTIRRLKQLVENRVLFGCETASEVDNCDTMF